MTEGTPRRRAMLVAGLVALSACGGGGNGQQIASDDPLVVEGERLFDDRGCGVCHSTDGGRRAGPTVKGLAGSTVPLAAGGSVVADDDYLLRSILDPDAQLTRGYPPNTMDHLAGTISSDDARAMVAYIKALR